MTQNVIKATVQCMIAQAEDCEKLGVTKNQGEKMIIEEFNQRRQEIIEFLAKNIDKEGSGFFSQDFQFQLNFFLFISRFLVKFKLFYSN